MGSHLGNRKIFAYLLIAIEIFVVIMYGVFLRPKVHNITSINVNYYPMYQDVNVMMLIGFGFLMTFIKSHAWSALSYTFFINAIIVQIYLLLAPFWQKVFHGGWDQKILNIQQMNFTGASYCVASVLIAFGAVLGRVGPLQLLIMSLVQVIGYTLNQQICYALIHIQDAGGSTVIHTFGAYFGLTVSLVLSRSVFPKFKPESNKTSNTFAMIGTLFLWMYWPSFNAGFFPNTGYEKTTIIANTIISLTGSCLSTFVLTALLRNKFSMEDILNATLAGGVMIGAGSGLFVNPAAALCIGLFAGSISTFGYYYLTSKLQQTIGLQDTCGVHNLHGIPGFLGGLFSAIAIAAYSSDPITNSTQSSLLPFYSSPYANRTFYQQGGIQVAGTVISLILGIVFGFIAGQLIKLVYVFEANQFYNDNIYFELEQQHGQEVKLNDTIDNNDKIIPGSHQKLKLPPLKTNSIVDNNTTL